MMSESQSNNKRIAKNTVMLYVRMLLSIIVSLYTSRVVLQTLGVEDYGIYGIVGGIVSMFSFLNASMAGATSRFMTFAMGKEDKKRLRDTFSTALIVHIGIALLVLLLAETIGFWFLCNKLVIPENRMAAAIIVYQCSIVSMIFAVTQVPYNATIIAHEQMDVYAYVELLHVFLKLGIVYLLHIGNYDKLIIYALLVLAVSFIIAMIYRLYCVNHYLESRFHWIWDKTILRPMLNFSGWNILGHLGFSIRTQGTNMVLNMFFGTAINAAGGLASTVQSILYQFSGNVITALKPQIIKNYAMGNYEGMAQLIYSGIKIGLLLILIMSIPILCSADFVLNLWLVDVPEYCVLFCKIMIWSNIVSSISQIINVGVQATGDLKKSSIVRNVIYVLTPFVLLGVFNFDSSNPSYAYYSILISQMLLVVVDGHILSSRVSNVRGMIIGRSVFLIFAIVCLCLLLCNKISYFINNNTLSFIAIIFISSFILMVSFYCIVFDKRERVLINSYILKKIGNDRL